MGCNIKLEFGKFSLEYENLEQKNFFYGITDNAFNLIQEHYNDNIVYNGYLNTDILSNPTFEPLFSDTEKSLFTAFAELANKIGLNAPQLEIHPEDSGIQDAKRVYDTGVTIVLTRGKNFGQRILHEFAHTLFDTYLINDTEFFTNIKKVYDSVAKAKPELVERIKDFAEVDQVKEFFADVMSDSRFQEELKKVYLEDSSTALYTKGIINTIAETLGDKHKTSKTALRRVLNLASATIESTKLEPEDFYKNQEDSYYVNMSNDVFVSTDETEFEEDIKERSKRISTVFLKNIYYKTDQKRAELKKTLSKEEYKKQISDNKFKLLDASYEAPVYRRDQTENPLYKVETEQEFDVILEDLQEGDLVKVPFLNWDKETKTWFINEDNEDKSIWMPVIYSKTGKKEVLVAKPWETKKEPEMGGIRSIPYNFVQGVRKYAGEVAIKQFDQKQVKNVNRKFGIQKGQKNETYYYYSEENKLFGPSFKQFAVLSSKLGDQAVIDSQLEALEGDISDKEASKTARAQINHELIKKLRQGDLVQVIIYDSIKKKHYKLWKPVMQVLANGVEVANASGKTFIHTNDTISKIAFRRTEKRKTEAQLLNKEILDNIDDVEVEGSDYSVKKLSNENFVETYVGRFDNLKSLNKNTKRKKRYTEQEAQDEKRKAIQSLEEGDIAKVQLTSNKGTYYGYRRVLAVSPKYLYVYTQSGEVLAIDYMEKGAVTNIAKRAQGIKSIRDSFNKLLKESKAFSDEFFSTKSKVKRKQIASNYKNAHLRIDDYYRMYDLNQFNRAYHRKRLKSGDIIKLYEDSYEGMLSYPVVKVVGSTVYTAQEYEGRYYLKPINIDNVVQIGKRKNKEVLKQEREALDKFYELKGSEEYFTFKSEESAKKYTDSKENTRYTKHKGKYVLQRKDKNGNWFFVSKLDQHYKTYVSEYFKKSGFNEALNLLESGDYLKDDEYIQLIESKVYNKDGELIGFKTKGGQKEGSTYFTNYVPLSDITKIGFNLKTYFSKLEQLNQLKPKPKANKSKQADIKGQKEDIKLLEEIANRLNKLHPEIDLKLMDAAGIAALGYDPSIRGVQHENSVIINKDQASRYDLLHEYGHILMAQVKVLNPILYKSIVDRSLDSPMRQYIQDLYPELSGEKLGEEIFLTALDADAKNKVFPPKTKTWWSSIKGLVRRFIQTVRKHLSNVFNTPDKKLSFLNTMNNYEFLNMSMNDLVTEFGDSILKNTIKQDSKSKALTDLGINISMKTTEEIDIISKLLNRKVCLN